MSSSDRPPDSELPAGRPRSDLGAYLVALGIMTSRLFGLLREVILARYLGNSDAADVFRAALRIPNFLQNLFGETALSASFIPVYSRLQAEGRRRDAERVASGVALLLALTVLALVSLGVLYTPALVDLITPGFAGEKRQFAIRLVRIAFPGTGILVLSAWCLGVLNSHRRFFLPYAAPVLWNGALIATLLYSGGRVSEEQLATSLTWAAVAGSGLQLLVQLPVTLSLLEGLHLLIQPVYRELRTVIVNFLPALIGRGVVQISAYIDSLLATLVSAGALSALAYAQAIYILPVSLFGIAVSASALPELSSITGSRDAVRDALVERLSAAIRRSAFYVIPSAVALLCHGPLVISLFYRRGEFGWSDVFFVNQALLGLAIGLYAATSARLYASAFYALRDTRTPLWVALARISLAAGLGYLLALHGPSWQGIGTLPLLGEAPPVGLGLFGIALAATLGALLEAYGLVILVSRRLGLDTRQRRSIHFHSAGRLPLLGSTAAGAASLSVQFLLPASVSVYLAAAGVLGTFGAVYLTLMTGFGHPELASLRARLHLPGRR